MRMGLLRTLRSFSPQAGGCCFCAVGAPPGSAREAPRGPRGVVFQGLEPRRSRSGASAAGVFCIAASLQIAAYLPKGSGLGESSKQQTTVV